MGTNNSCLPSQACERDVQCGTGTCCAISLWLRGLRMCTPLGREGEECHPGSRKVLHRLAQGREPVTQLDWTPIFRLTLGSSYGCWALPPCFLEKAWGGVGGH